MDEPETIREEDAPELPRDSEIKYVTTEQMARILHPGESWPTCSVEACGETASHSLRNHRLGLAAWLCETHSREIATSLHLLGTDFYEP